MTEPRRLCRWGASLLLTVVGLAITPGSFLRPSGGPVIKGTAAQTVRPVMQVQPVLPVAPGAPEKRPELILPLGHTQGIFSVALSKDSTRFVSASSDGTAILWDMETGKPLYTLPGGRRGLTWAAWSADGRRVLTGSGDNTAVLWDANTGRPLKTFQELAGLWPSVNSVALSADGKRFLIGCGNSTAILWSVETAKPLQTFRGHTDQVGAVALSADGKRVLTGSLDKTAILWDAASGKALQTFQGGEKAVERVALSADGKRVLTGSYGTAAVLWDADTAKPLKRFPASGYVALSPDAKFVLTEGQNDTATLWDVATGQRVQTLRGPQGYGSSFRAVAFGADGTRALTSSENGRATLWDVTTGKPLRTFQLQPPGVSNLTLSGDGRRVLTTVGSKMILWDVDSARPVQTFQGFPSAVRAVALSGDGKQILTGHGYPFQDPVAILWDTRTGQPRHTWLWHFKEITCAVLSADGKRALTGSVDTAAILYDTATGKPIQIFKGNKSRITSVALSADGRRVLTWSAYDGEIVWDADSAKPLKKVRIPIGQNSPVAWSKDWKRVLASGADRSATLRDADTGKLLQTLRGHSAEIVSVALSADGRRAVTGSADGTAILWDADTGKQLQVFRGPRWPIRVAIAPGGVFVVTGSRDGVVQLWKPGRVVPVVSFLAVAGEWLAWTPEGYYTSSPNGEGLIAWKVYDDSPQGFRIVAAGQFRKRFFRPDLFRHLLQELDLGKALALADQESNHPVEAPTTIAQALPPVVVLTRPAQDGAVAAGAVTVEAVAVSVGDHPVTRMRLLLDGRPHLADFQVPAPRLGKAKRVWQVELEPGPHTVQVVAESAAGSEGRSDVLNLRRQAATETLPRLFALAIGVSHYQKEALRKDVYYATADARKLTETLAASSKPLYREITITRLLDQDATRKKILQALNQIRKKATQRDAVVIFFAGHGTRDDQGTFYFLPVEVDLNDLSSTGLSEGDFKNAVRAMPGRVILLLDACHSGALIESGGRSGEGLTDKLYRDLTSNEYGLVVMCSSKGVEKSFESPMHKSGVFTLALVEGLQGKAVKSSDGAVYLKALDAYVTDRVSVLSEGRQHPLTSQPTTISNIPLTRPE